MIQLSPGQERVREIINDYYPKYIEECNRLGEDNVFKISYQSYKILRPIFKEDKLIRADSITGRSLEDCGLSNNYLRWLSCKAGNDWDKFRCKGSVPSEICFDKHHPVHNQGFAFEGGRKYDSTFSCLIALYERKFLSSGNWDFVYYPQDGIIESGSGGHHRTLAHVLYGEPRMNPGWFYIVDSRPDCQLHSAFLFIEKVVNKLNEVLQSKTRGYNHRLFFEVVKFSNNEEIELIRYFQDFINKNDWEVLSKVFSHEYAFIPFVRDESINVYQLIDLINSCRKILGYSSLYRMYLIAQDWVKQPNYKSTVLEQLLLDLPLI
jgi:hypothetical protein